MRTMLAWIRQQFAMRHHDGEFHSPPAPWESHLPVLEAEELITKFRRGEQADLQDLLCACMKCNYDDQEFRDLIVEHNRSLRNRRNSAA